MGSKADLLTNLWFKPNEISLFDVLLIPWTLSYQTYNGLIIRWVTKNANLLKKKTCYRSNFILIEVILKTNRSFWNLLGWNWFLWRKLIYKDFVVRNFSLVFSFNIKVYRVIFSTFKEFFCENHITENPNKKRPEPIPEPRNMEKSIRGQHPTSDAYVVG